MYHGTWIIFGVVMAPVYVMLLAWFLGKPRDIRKALLGLGMLVGTAVALWGGMFLVSMLFRFVFYQPASL